MAVGGTRQKLSMISTVTNVGAGVEVDGISRRTAGATTTLS